MNTNGSRRLRFSTVTGILAIATLALLSGCNLLGGSGDNLSVNFMLKDEYASSRALTTNPTWTTARAEITEIVFGYDDGGDGFSDTVPARSTIDLLTGNAEPALPSYRLGPGTYRSVYFGAELFDDGATASIFLEGEWNGTPIQVVFKSGEVFEAVAGELTVAEGETYEINVLLDPNEWFSSMTDTDLNGASTEADGTIVLSGTSNADLFDKHFASSLDAATQTVLPGGTPD